MSGHTDACPAAHNARHGCSCLLRGVAGQRVSGHDPLCWWRPDEPQPDGSVIGYPPCLCDRLRQGGNVAYAKGLIEGDSGGRREGYRIGQRDAVAAAVARVEALNRNRYAITQSDGLPRHRDVVLLDEVIATIKGVE